MGSVNIALAKKLADTMGGPTEIIRIYDYDQRYFNYQFNQEWIDLLVNAKSLIFPVPMWNLSIPAALKDFLDKVIKKGQVWDIDKNNQFIGLLKDRPTYIIMTSGDYYLPGHPHDFVVPYLQTLLRNLGIKTVKDFRIGGVKGDASLLADKKFMEAKTKEMFKAFGLSNRRKKKFKE